MSVFKKFSKDIANQTGSLTGSILSSNTQNATNSAIHGMNLFREIAEAKKNVDFSKSKGNLFEYIEAAKFNRNSANSGSRLNAVVTDSVGRPHDPVDIEILKDGKVVREVQAKFSDSQKAASDSVTMQRGDKYKGMQRLIRKENNYTDSATGEKTTLLKKAKSLAESRASKDGSIYQEQYRDVADNITDELHHDGVSSGGTTLEELRKAHSSPAKYARAFEHKQVAVEMKQTAKNMAAASMVTTGMVSGISNLFAVFQDEKELSQALHDVGADVVKSGVRGGTTGVISTAIRYQGVKSGSALLSDSTAATVMAGGIIDGGVALYSYARGEISAEELRDELVDTTAKAASTIFYTKAITAIMGTGVTPFIPMAVYTTASYVITCTREILRNAKLNTEEYERMTALFQESTKTLKDAHEQFRIHVNHCEQRQREMLEGFINSFEYDLETGKNYDQAIYSIVSFADQAGIVLQHADFDDFRNAMNNKTTFVLK